MNCNLHCDTSSRRLEILSVSDMYVCICVRVYVFVYISVCVHIYTHIYT